MKQHRILATGVTLAVLLGATVAYAMSDMQLQCERDTYLRYLERETDAYRISYNEAAAARAERIDRYAQSLTITDDRDRKQENRQIERDYDDRLDDAEDERRDLLREIKREYKDDIRRCRDEQRDRCERIECPNGRRVNTCDEEGNPLTNPCEGQQSSSSRSSRSSSSRFSSSRFSSSRSSSSSQIFECPPIVCPDGRVFPRCQEEGIPIHEPSPCNDPVPNPPAPRCGNGICEDGEADLYCPICILIHPQPPGCECRPVCDADCR